MVNESAIFYFQIVYCLCIEIGLTEKSVFQAILK